MMQKTPRSQPLPKKEPNVLTPTLYAEHAYLPYILQRTISSGLAITLTRHRYIAPSFSRTLQSRQVSEVLSLNMPYRKLTSTHFATHGLMAAQISNAAVAMMNIKTTASSFLESRSAAQRQPAVLLHDTRSLPSICSSTHSVPIP